MARAKKDFSPAYRDEAVKMVIDSSRPIAQVARELRINEGTLENWVEVFRRALRSRRAVDALGAGSAA